MDNYAQWQQQSAITQFGKQQRSKIDFFNLVEKIINGEDPDLEGVLLSLPEDWEKQLSDWENEALRNDDKKRHEELGAVHSFFRLQRNISTNDSTNLLAQVEQVRCLVTKANSLTLESFVLGSLGATLISRGLTATAFHLTQEAVAAAKRGDLKWAELQWAINLSLFRFNDEPKKGDEELRNLLIHARELGDLKKIGLVLNNLAYVNERFLSNLIDAIRFQEEAVAIAHATGDEVSELGRSFHLANMQERVSQIQPALKNYDRGLAIDAAIGISEFGFKAFRRVTHLIASQYREGARKILASHMTIDQAPHSEGAIRKMLEEVQKGAVMMSSWDPSSGSIEIKPDPFFAKELSLHREWRALSVYGCQWMDHGLLMGDSQGLHWLAVAMQSLSYPGIAMWALTMAMDLPKAFGTRPQT